MKWQKGRQKGQYEKLKLFSFICIDCYLIRYKPGYQLPMHIDKVEGKKHYRLNILLKGEDAYVGEYLFKIGRVVCFRSDLLHGTTKLTKKRMLLSFGWAI